VTIKGKGGHGALPHECVDALEIGTQVVSALQRIASRQANPLQPTVLSVGSFHSGTAENAIPETAEISGTIRTFDSEWAASWDSRLRTVVGGVCQSMGAEYELELSNSYPPVKNDPEAAAMMQQAAADIISADKIIKPEPAMTGEDISFYFEKAKGAMGLIGVGTPNGAPLHSPSFIVPEENLVNGSALFVQLAINALSGANKE